jgi:hypothetical protein
MKFWFICLLAGASLLVGCEGFFGKRTDKDFLDIPVYRDREVAYVPIQPVIDEGLNRPVDVIAGWDELIYVADGGNEEIVSYDQAGNELGRFGIPGLKAIAQDRRLDILALGTRDTNINGSDLTLPAIYRVDLNKSGDYGLNNARIKNIVVHPFYFKSGTPSGNDQNSSFEGIDVLADNRYLVSRNGFSNSTSQFGGPDNAILVFTPEDEYQTPVAVNTSLGLFNNYFNFPKGITTQAKPPQTPAIDQSGSFVFTSTDPGTSLRVQWIEFIVTPNGASYEVRNLPAGDTSKAEGFLYVANRFEDPVDVTLTGDGTNYIFVVDRARDSLYQFNALGFEGVNPPAGANSGKAIKVSFGGTGEGLTQFREPSGVAYLNRIVYVADAGNGRILRFRLTLDFD